MIVLPLHGQHDRLSAEISGRARALDALADLVAKTETEETVRFEGGEPSAYPFRVTSIVIRASDVEFASVALDGNQLLIEAHPGNLEMLASNIRFAGRGTAAPGIHNHVEYYPGHPFLARGAIPLTFVLD
jgi:hypothetical protein